MIDWHKARPTIAENSPTWNGNRMTKALTVGQKKRGRKRKDGPRQPNGQLSRMPKATQEENMAVALAARAKHAFLANPPKIAAAASPEEVKIVVGMRLDEMRRDAKQPWLGCLAGRMVQGQKDVVELWGTIKLIRSRRRAWLLSIGTTEHPLVMRWQTEPERMETRPDDAPADLRTDEERARDARQAWAAVESAVNRVDPSLARYVERVVCRDESVYGPPLAAVLRMIGKALA